MIENKFNNISLIVIASVI